MYTFYSLVKEFIDHFLTVFINPKTQIFNICCYFKLKTSWKNLGLWNNLFNYFRCIGQLYGPSSQLLSLFPQN